VKTKGKVGKGSETVTDEADSDAEECAGDDDGESKMAKDNKDSVKQAQEKVTKPGKPQQKMTKSKAVDGKEEVKSDRVKPEQSKQIKASL